MTANEILTTLRGLGSESIKSVLIKHGAKEPFYGVKIEELKKLQKKIKKNYALSLELYDTGISDAMYLAGLIADPAQMTTQNLEHWADKAFWSLLCEYTVAGVAAESRYGWELAETWIKDKKELKACIGWATLAHIITLKPNEELDVAKVKNHLDHIALHIHQSPNRVRYVMNGFVISAGCSIPELTEYAALIGTKIGKVDVNVGDTACKVPSINAYIDKAKQQGALGRKKKTAIC